MEMWLFGHTVPLATNVASEEILLDTAGLKASDKSKAKCQDTTIF